MILCNLVSRTRQAGPPELPADLEDLPALLTVDEVAVLLRTSSKAVYAMKARGLVPGAIRVGTRVLFARDDLLRWLQVSRASSPKETRR